MKITHRLGIISFCNRFTDPEAIGVPIACLLVGQDESMHWVAAVVGWTPEADDPISQRLLKDVPRLIKSHVENVFAKPNNEWTPESILYSLHDELRNAVHVSWVGPELATELEDSVDTIRLAKTGLRDAMNKTIAQFKARLTEVRSFFQEPAGLMKKIDRSSSVQWFPAAATSSPALHI